MRYVTINFQSAAKLDYTLKYHDALLALFFA